MLDEEVEREIAACHHLADSSVPPDASLGTRRWTLWKENSADKYKEWQELNKEKRREAKDQWEEQNQGEKVKHSFFCSLFLNVAPALLPRVNNCHVSTM